MEKTSELAEKLTSDLKPAQILALRVEAFSRGDFGTIYDTYHPDSFFREQFPDRVDYMQFGWAHLRRDFRIQYCEPLRRRQISSEEVHLIFHQIVKTAGQEVETLEMARFYLTSAGWRYHSSQKMEREEFSGSVEDIDFPVFDRIRHKVFF